MIENSLEQILLKVAQDTMRNRIRTWLNYEWEKQYLPYILDEVTKNVRIELISNANIPDEIRVGIKFVKTEIVK